VSIVTEATQEHSDALADILWFIKGRMSALSDAGRICELGVAHISAIEAFRSDLPKIDHLKIRCIAAEYCATSKPRGKRVRK